MAREHCLLVTSSKVVIFQYLLMIELIQCTCLLYMFWARHSELIDFGVCQVQGIYYLTLSVKPNILEVSG